MLYPENNFFDNTKYLIIFHFLYYSQNSYSITQNTQQYFIFDTIPRKKFCLTTQNIE